MDLIRRCPCVIALEIIGRQFIVEHSTDAWVANVIVSDPARSWLV